MGVYSTDKTLRVFDEGFHELHNDVEKDKLKAVVTQWMKERLEGKQLKKFGKWMRDCGLCNKIFFQSNPG